MPHQKITLVTGKGGVGKSTVAAALAKSQARAGKKTLLIELNERSYFSWVYDKPFAYEPSPVEDNLWLSVLKGEEALKEFLLYYVRIKRVADLFFDNRVMKSLVQAAPALKELALLGKITSGQRGIGPDLDYDHLVIDGFASGHFKALMNVPHGMSEAVKRGPMGEQSEAIDKVLKNRDVTRTFIVTLPEELPVTETLELYDYLLEERGQDAEILFNRWLALPASSEELMQWRESAQEEAGFLSFLEATQSRQAESQARLEAKNKEAAVRLPYLLEPSAQKRIDQLTQAMESQWKT